MNISEQPSGPVVSQTAWVRILSLIAPLLLAVQLVFSLVTYSLLPAIVPSHWNAAGQVDSYMSKLGFVLVFVGISLGMFILFRGIGALVKRAGDQSKIQLATSIISVVTFFPLVVNLVVQVITTGVILHW